MSTIPEYLYKIISDQSWNESQNLEQLQLDEMDHEFIHLSTEEQLERIIDKYWQDSHFIVLQLDSSKLVGKLVLEANSGGTNKYYHLYDGFIPLKSIHKSFNVKARK